MECGLVIRLSLYLLTCAWLKVCIENKEVMKNTAPILDENGTKTLDEVWESAFVEIEEVTALVVAGASNVEQMATIVFEENFMI